MSTNQVLFQAICDGAKEQGIAAINEQLEQDVNPLVILNETMILEPLLLQQGYKSKGKLAIGTVQGDLHDIVKNIVVVMLKGAGYEVEDLGVDCSLETYEKAIKDGAQVLLLSALLTTTMPRMKEIVDFFKEHYPEVKVRLVIGGAPVSQRFADEIGADAYGEEASLTPGIVGRLLS